jgi:hypothetical protein
MDAQLHDAFRQAHDDCEAARGVKEARAQQISQAKQRNMANSTYKKERAAVWEKAKASNDAADKAWKEEYTWCWAEGVAKPPRPNMVMKKDVWAAFERAHGRDRLDGALGDPPEGSSDSNGGYENDSGEE